MGKWAVKQDADGNYICKRCSGKFSAADTQRRVYCSEECANPEHPTEKTCEQCGETYEPHPITAWKQRFCGDLCQRQWWLENREEHGKVYTYTCQNCGEEYETLFSNRDKCCSMKCVGEYVGELHSKRAQINKQCPICKETFKGAQSGSDYCSDECRLKRVCVQCGEEFKTDHAANTLCSDECRRERNRESYEQYMTAKLSDRSYVCQECGVEFAAPYGDKRRKYCSLDCSRKSYLKSPAGRAQKRRQRHRRRARQYSNGKVEDIDPQKVFERDNWQCGICQEQVNSDLEFPHPKSASLDHIIPLAEGGTHTWGNVQLAHFICNSNKRDVGGGQLRLGITHVSV